MRSSLGAAVDTMSRFVMVRRTQSLNTGIRWSMYPNLVGNQLLFVGSTTNPIVSNINFFGFLVYNFQGGSVLLVSRNLSSPVKMVNGGQDFVFLPLNGVVGSVVTDGSEFYRLQPISMVLFPYDDQPSGIAFARAPNPFRWDQNTSPSVTPDEKYVVWQNLRVGENLDGSADQYNIDFEPLGAGPNGAKLQTTAVDSTFQLGAWMKRYWKNVRPTFAPDGSKIVYFVDSTGTFEPCIMNMNQGVPDIDSRHALMVDERHGIFNRAGVAIGDKTFDGIIFEWSPAESNKLGFLDDSKHLCILDATAENVQVLSYVGKIQEFAWGADGRIAAITSSGVLIVNQSGTVDSVFAKEKETDLLAGIAWSPDPSDLKLAFRMIRKGKSTADSFSALVLYSLNSRQWYYATPRIPWATEPTVPYKFLRAVFEADNNGIYFPAPNPAAAGGNQVTIYHSF
jgi:hypothetical protein